MAQQQNKRGTPKTKAKPAATGPLSLLPKNPWTPPTTKKPVQRKGAPFKPPASTPQSRAAAVTPNATPKAARADAIRTLKLGNPLTKTQAAAVVDPKGVAGSGAVRSSRPAPARARATSTPPPASKEAPLRLGRFGQPNAPLPKGVPHSNLESILGPVARAAAPIGLYQ